MKIMLSNLNLLFELWKSQVCETWFGYEKQWGILTSFPCLWEKNSHRHFNLVSTSVRKQFPSYLHFLKYTRHDWKQKQGILTSCPRLWEKNSRVTFTHFSVIIPLPGKSIHRKDENEVHIRTVQNVDLSLYQSVMVLGQWRCIVMASGYVQVIIFIQENLKRKVVFTTTY